MPKLKGTFNDTTSVIFENLYPIVAEKLKSRTPQFRRMIQDFMNRNAKNIQDIAPYYNIYHTASDVDAFFKSIDIPEKKVIEIMKDCFYWDINYNPGAAKEPLVVVCICAMRFYLMQRKKQEAYLTAIYLCFSGKFYASVYSSKGVFPKVSPGTKYKPIMDYVVNNMLTQKSYLKTKGSIFGAVRAICETFVDAYADDLTSDLNDDEIGKLIQQLRDRLKAFLYEIASKFYRAKESGVYITTDHENLDTNVGDFKLTENDSNKAARITEQALNYMTNNSANMKFCEQSKNVRIRAVEIKDIIEAISTNKDYIGDLRTVINILICDYLRNYPRGKVNSPEFIVNSIRPKPNARDKYLVQLKEIIINWLDESSANYRKRKSVKDTANSYYKAILTYITLVISYVAKND